jgi:hypothetical protein
VIWVPVGCVEVEEDPNEGNGSAGVLEGVEGVPDGVDGDDVPDGEVSVGSEMRGSEMWGSETDWCEPPTTDPRPLAEIWPLPTDAEAPAEPAGVLAPTARVVEGGG